MSKIVLHDSTFRQFSEFIYERTGIYIPPTKKYLVENRLLKVIEDNNIKGYDELYYMVKFGANGREVTRMLDAITTNETYFFREPHQFEVLVENIISRVVQDKKVTKDVRFWSAACSTGDEPYTVAMVVKERRPNVRMDIMGSDLSTSVIESARRGVYSSYAVRNVPALYLGKYFSKQGQEFKLDQSITDAVRFKNINLVEPGRAAEAGAMDVIFCRNVLIYFDEKSKKKAVSFLYDSLRPGGFLFIGSSESLHNVTRAFMPITINKVVVYQKV